MRFSKIFRIRLGSRILASKIQLWNEELHTHYGITNETHDGMYVPFWDFIEDEKQSNIERALLEVQDKYELSYIYLLQTYPKLSFRAVGFDLLEWKEYIKILASTDLIDLSYLKHSVMRGRAVIRVSEKDGTKNKLVRIIERFLYDDLPEQLSIDHWQFFSAVLPEMPKPVVQLKNIRVRVSKYESFR